MTVVPLRTLSPRGWFLGIRRDDAEPHIYQGVCTSAFGYLTSRDEAEVIARTVIDVEPIAVLTSAPA